MTFKEQVLECFRVNPENEYMYGGKVKVTETGDTYQVEVSRMYDHFEVSFDVLKKLAELFGTESFNVDKDSSSGCETCDWGSKYSHTFYVNAKMPFGADKEEEKNAKQ